MWKLEGLDKKENADDLAKREQEITDWLAGFWNDKEKDTKFLEKTNGKDVVKSITDDLDKKSKELNDPKAKAKIEALSKNVKWYAEIWKLNEKQARELSDIYKTINSIEWTEHAEDAKWWEEAKKSMDMKNQEQTKKLTDACDRLDELLKSHSEEAKTKVENDAKKWQATREEAEKTSKSEVASFEANMEFPPSQKETTSEA